MKDLISDLIDGIRRSFRLFPLSVLLPLVAVLGLAVLSFRAARDPHLREFLQPEGIAGASMWAVLLGGAVLVSAAEFMLRYLRSDDSDSASYRSSSDLDDAVARLKALERASGGLSTETRIALIAEIKAEASAGIADEMQARLESRFGPAIDVIWRVRQAQERSERTVARLETEIRALMRRGNLNLVLGTVTTVSAVAVLAYVALTATLTSENWRGMLPAYLLRLSLVVFVEVFAFFFLRLYRASLHEIKYFQNEITNIELKLIALELSVLSGDAQSANKVVTELAKTERNFILKKDETTLELERARLDSRQLQEALARVTEAIPWNRNK